MTNFQDPRIEDPQGVYSLLVELGGASEHFRNDFVYHATHGGFREWRFCGIFGFGGKIYNDGRSLRVDYYREDHTPRRAGKRLEINEKLKEFVVY